MSIIDQIVDRISTRLANLRADDQPIGWAMDVHSHLLAGVDDGLSTHEEVLTCLNQFVHWGIQHIVTTPHINRSRFPNTRTSLLAGQAALRKLIEHYKLPLTIDVAAEYMVDDLFLELLKDGQLLSFGRQRYVLIELGWEAPPVFLDTVLFQMQIKGYQPVLAHPERYTYYAGNEKTLAKMRDLGCLFQINWGSFVGQYGSAAKKQAHFLMRKRWVDFVGSDLHSPSDLTLFDTFIHSPIYRQLSQLPLRNKTFLVDGTPPQPNPSATAVRP
ncbi:MAG: histidinol-phosphatase [Cytophagales bacterium]|nr:MAG: histidinol-phosphatase [Cytophagales bacterium]